MVSQIDWYISAEVKTATTFNFIYASFGQHIGQHSSEAITHISQIN